MSKLINPVSGEVKELTIHDFLDLFDESVRSKILESAARYQDRIGIACFENLDMCSSYCGNKSALVIGPSNTVKTFEQLAEPGSRLGDVPSRFQYPVAYVRVGN